MGKKKKKIEVVKGAAKEASDSNSEDSVEESSDTAVEEERDLDFSEIEQGDEIAQLKKELEDARNEARSNHESYLRALADFDNARKQAIKERSEFRKYEGEQIILDMIDILDNFDLAMESKDADLEQLRSGLEMIQKLFVEALQRREVRSESAVGEVFNPEKHNALSRIAQEGAEPGTVVNELKKAYFYKDKLIRAADVVVADGPKKSEEVAVSQEVDLSELEVPENTEED